MWNSAEIIHLFEEIKKEQVSSFILLGIRSEMQERGIAWRSGVLTEREYWSWNA